MERIVMDIASELEFWLMVVLTFARALFVKEAGFKLGSFVVTTMLKNKAAIKTIFTETATECEYSCEPIGEFRRKAKEKIIVKLFG